MTGMIGKKKVTQHINYEHRDTDESKGKKFVYLRHHLVFKTDVVLSVTELAMMKNVVAEKPLER